jgi:hypothetical protein
MMSMMRLKKIHWKKIKGAFHGLIKLDLKDLVDPHLQEKHSNAYISIVFIQVTWRINIIL